MNRLILLLLFLSPALAATPKLTGEALETGELEVTAEQIAELAGEVGPERVEEIKSNVLACLNDVNDCDCAAFGDEESASAYCNKIVGGVMACLSDFSRDECQAIDPTKIVVNGVSLSSVIKKKVLNFDEAISDCVMGSDCDCTVFPKSVQALCSEKQQLQVSCLEDYDLEACNELENPEIKIFPDFTPDWIIAILDPIIRPLVEWRQQSERDSAIGGAMNFIGQCFQDPYNCDCSPIKYPSIRADCMQRARLMRFCLDYRDCMTTIDNPKTGDECTGREECTKLVNMPLVPEVTPDFMKPLIEPEVLKHACPLMKGWPYDKGNYAACD